MGDIVERIPGVEELGKAVKHQYVIARRNDEAISLSLSCDCPEEIASFLNNVFIK
jgi:hypothetical protein